MILLIDFSHAGRLSSARTSPMTAFVLQESGLGFATWQIDYRRYSSKQNSERTLCIGPRGRMYPTS